MTEKTKSAIAKEQFYAEGNELPKCANDGCNNDVVVREWKYWSFKSECIRCTTARKNNNTILGVTIHKKNYCENIDGHLGFSCPVDPESWPNHQESLDLDHLDGNHMNNTPNNIKTYCKLCHNRKSKETGDWHSKKASGRSFN